MIIGAILILAGIGMASGGSWGAAFVTWVIALFVIGCWSAAKDDAKAYVNRTSYWSMSGKDRAKARHRWEEQARAEEAMEREKAAQKAERREMRKRRRLMKEQERMPPPAVPDDSPTEAELLDAKRKREAYIARQRSINHPPANSQPSMGSGPVRVCHYCGRYVEAYEETRRDRHGRFVEYRCPRCGRINQTQLRA